MEYRVADLSLAEFGRKEITIAEAAMLADFERWIRDHYQETVTSH